MNNSKKSRRDDTLLTVCFSLRMLLLALCLVACNVYAAKKDRRVDGTLFGRPFSTQVDNEFAARMLTNRQDTGVVNLFARYGDVELSEELLANITKQYSLNVSGLFFVERFYAQERNRQLQDYYLSVIDTLPAVGIEQQFAFLKDCYIVFVPAFNYESNAGNFREQRMLLDSAGIPNEIVKTQQWGPVAENADLIARQLQEAAKLHRNIIVVSVSKGGLETALALEKLSNSDALGSVKAWINASGILKGSPAADNWLISSKNLWLRIGLFFAGIRKVPLKQLLNDLSYEQRRATPAPTIPRSIYTINLIVGKLMPKKEQNNRVVPGDGYSPLLDEIVPEGDVVFEMNADHTFEGVNLNVRMVALMQYIVNKTNINE